MRKQESSKRVISLLTCEFFDKRLEYEYRQYDISNAIKYVGPILLMLGISFFLFIIPDFFIIQDKKALLVIFLNRLVFLALITLFYFKIKTAKTYDFYYRWITFYEVIVCIFFMVTLYNYENPNLFIQSFGIMLIIMGIFLVPNRWINSVFIAFMLAAGFLFVFSLLDSSYTIRDNLAVLTYLVFVILLSSVSSSRTNYYKRTQYIQQKQLLKMAETDQLTGIYNRFKFEQELNSYYSDKKFARRASVILMDVDDFKRINDEFGHLKGDNVLIGLSLLFRNVIHKDDILARWGGEEFMILLPETSLDEAVVLAEKIKTILNSQSIDGIKNVTCSFGIVEVSEYDDKNTLIHQVDKRLYKAKRQGKNQIVSEL